ncbi:hypothetical protein F5Y16DRAFT_107962 [Xylariaceae sp. FL0255]|nr:hypothetical protein F5Y16DRAFT_107962 [Xylariaceae sp. FL0255]
MSDPTILSHPGDPPPPPAPAISDEQAIRASLAATIQEPSRQPPNDAGVSSSSGPVSAVSTSPPSQATTSPPSVPSSIFPTQRSLPISVSGSAAPSVSGSGSQTATQPATTTSPPTTTTSGGGGGGGGGRWAAQQPPPQNAQAGPSNANMGSLNPTLPSRSSQLHIAEARAALVASMSNMLDNELQSRASLLHQNATALSKQERDVAKATEALKKENDKLAKVAKDTGRKIKELGNVQNWAEVLETDLLMLEETMRIVKHGDVEDKDGDGDSCSTCSGSSYWSGSESGSEGEGGSGGGGGARDVGRKGEDGDVSKAATADLSSTSGVNVSLDGDILESLTEAMATDMHLGPCTSKLSSTSSAKGFASQSTLAATPPDHMDSLPAQAVDTSSSTEVEHSGDPISSPGEASEQLAVTNGM